jgi:hypothetical protein
MGAPADVHCYTPAEFERKLESQPRLAQVAAGALELVS